MFGSKLRAWMEAVRPKKKQHRKDKQGKAATSLTNGPNTNNHTVSWQNKDLLNSEKKEEEREPKQKIYTGNQVCKNGVTDSQLSRYSATNLSSPESAYSTGYSTDGTSPGAPPDYLLNTTTKITESCYENRLTPQPKSQSSCTKISKCISSPHAPIKSPLVQESQQANSGKARKAEVIDRLEEKDPTGISSTTILYAKITENSTTVLVSPRQRNRIRTNPWLPGGTSSAVPSPLPIRQEVKMTPVPYKNFRNSPTQNAPDSQNFFKLVLKSWEDKCGGIQNRYLSPVTHRRSLSSSSCSSLSAGANLPFDHHFPRSLSDEDDCTLNEMMGKYDESYVYEKETDILSDSDPTDCESDIDTGQDGGDEEDTADVELDFIDNGSYLELDCKSDNTGHCLYFAPPDMQRKRSSRKRTTKRSKEFIERRRRPSNSRKCHKHSERPRHSSLHQDGSKSAGATPVSVRRSSLRPVHLKSGGQEECLKKRSNSVCLQRDSTVLIDKRDREADLKYRELIGQAEQIIRTMNVNGLSPRRLPGPTNKRVELLRSTECAKPEVLFKNKPNDETLTTPPSTTTFKNTRFSPKKNHITNFIINNSPVLVRKELQAGHSPISIRRNLAEETLQSPLAIRKHQQCEETVSFYKKHPNEEFGHHHGLNVVKKSVKEYHEVTFGSPAAVRKTHQPKSILHKAETGPISILSPSRHRRSTEVPVGSSSSDEEEFTRFRKKLSKSCPQSEPVRRKVYFGRNTINIAKGHGKTVAFNLRTDVPTTTIATENNVGSSENLRHQVLLNTIQSLKKNLEDQSASLHQTYRSTQNMYKY